MTEPPTPRKRMHPVVTVGLIVLAIWILLAVCMGEQSLDRADKAASVIAMLVGLGALTVTVVELQRRSAQQDSENSPPNHSSLLKRPSVVTGVATMAVGLLIVVVVGLASGGADTSEEPASEAGGSSPSEPPPTTDAPSVSPSESSPTEPCASPGQAASGVSPTVTAEVVRHDGTLILAKGYYADLDSLCPDWDVTDVAGTKQDIGNDGRGLTRSITAGTQIAVVEKKAAATFAMCSSNTDYVSSAIQYADLNPGDRFCVLTDAGRRSLVTVLRVRGGGDRKTVHVEVRTWAEKQPSEETNYLPWVIGGLIVLALLGGGATSAATKGDKEEG
ncbi:hypothetical protein DER29_0685 [Micromonospora sp. M71_S20]|uniref:hypothetical protein n=1 Tax=Micromonospora sp. M71_S20 TaxID=592872 RepID=UPI000F2A07CC|nr:hypothetical protein [Micromonospora sp. M71_S20]RLK22840.1 hypothetical protein DER29_0685 [Micromonospora sp. M71_S20]